MALNEEQKTRLRQSLAPQAPTRERANRLRTSLGLEPDEEPGYGEVLGKSVVRGGLGIVGGVGDIATAAGEAIGSKPLTQVGTETSEWAREQQAEGFAAADEYLNRGTFLENPSLKRATGLVGQALPSLGLGVATGGATAAALRGAGMAAGAATTVGSATAAGTLGALEGAPQYREAREAGKSIRQSLAVGGASTLGTAALEFLPISRILRRAGTGAARGAAKGALEEGVQESSQQLFQNVVAKVGYDDTQRLTEGLVESAIAGAGSGGIVGGVTGRIGGQQKRQDEADQARLSELFGEGSQVKVQGGMAQVSVGDEQFAAPAQTLVRMKEADVSNDELVGLKQEVDTQIDQSPEARAFAEEALEPTVRPEDLGPVSSTTREALAGMNAEEFGQYLEDVETDGTLQEGERRFLQEQGPQLLGRLQALESAGIGEQGQTQARKPLAQQIAEREAQDRDAVSALRTGLGTYLGQQIDEQAYRPARAPEELRDSITEIERALNKRVVFFEQSDDAPMKIDGITNVAEDTVFVNRNAERPHLAVTGHEVKHEIRRDNREVYDEFARTMRKITPASKLAELKKSLDVAKAQEQPDRAQPATREEVEEEFFADVFGDQMVQPQFWEKVSKEMSESPGAFETLVRTTTGMVEKISRAFSPASQEVKDLQKAQDAAVKAFTRYARKRQESQPRFKRLEQGQTFYHGTNRDFEQFNTPAWFTSDPALADTYARQRGDEGVNIRPVRLKLKNPYKVQDFQDLVRVTPGMADALERAGYDGMVHEDPDGVTTAVPFKAESIQGEFAPRTADSPENQFEQEPQAPQASRFFRMTEEGDLVAERTIGPQENASGESAASIEAQQVQRSRARQGRQVKIIDTRSGQERPAIGPRPEDNALNPYDVLVEDGPQGQRTILNQGEKAGPSFSRPKEALESVSQAGKEGFKQVKESIRETIKNPDSLRVRTLPTMLKTVPMSFLVDMFEPRLPRLRGFYRKMREQTATQNGLVNEAKNRYDAATKAAKDSRTVTRLNRAAALATFNQVTPWLKITEQDWVAEGATSLGRAGQGQAAIEEAEALWERSGMVEMTDGLSFRQAYKQAREAYDELPSDVQDAYREVVQDAADMRTRERDGLIRRINFITEEPAAGETEEAAQRRSDLREKLMRQVEQRYSSVRGAYLPLSRVGEYFINVRDAESGQTVYQQNFETPARQAMARRYWQGKAQENPNLVVRSSVNEQRNAADIKVPAEFAQEIASLVEAKYMEGVDRNDEVQLRQAQLQAQEAVSAINQTWLQWQPDISALKNSIQRKNVKGFDEDMMRSYLEYMINHAGSVSYSEHGFDMERDLLQMKRETREKFRQGADTTVDQMILNDLTQRLSGTRNSRTNELASMLGMVSSFYYMTSPSMLLVQMSQLGLTTLPHLASQAGIGAKSAAQGLMNASRKAFSPRYSVDAIMGNENVTQAIDAFTATVTSEMKTADTIGEYADKQVGAPALSDEAKLELFESLSAYEQELFVLRYAQHRNLLDITATHEAYDIVRKRGGAGVMHHAMYFMRNGELASRKAATLAAFDLARTKRKDDFFAAFNFAEYVNTRTLFDYSKQGKPPFMQGSVSRAVLQFKTFPVNMSFHLGRIVHQSLKGQSAEVRTQARKEFIGVMGMAGVLSGVVGTPLAYLFDVLDMALGDDDEPVNSRREFENILTDMVGETAARAITEGAPTLIGANVSRRLGISGMFNLLGESPEWMHGSSYAAYAATRLLGPSYSVFDGVVRGYDEIVNKGDYMDGLIAATPKAIRDGLRTWQTLDGGIRTGQGRKLAPDEAIGPGDLFLLAIGIYPDAIAAPRQANRDLSEIATKISERRGRLMRDFAKAVEDGDVDGQDETVEAVREFNKKNPRYPVTSSDLMGAWKRLAKGELGLTGERETAIAEEYDLPVYRQGR